MELVVKKTGRFFAFEIISVDSYIFVESDIFAGGDACKGRT